jgi:hypothetical protein
MAAHNWVVRKIAAYHVIAGDMVRTDKIGVCVLPDAAGLGSPRRRIQKCRLDFSQ